MNSYMKCGSENGTLIPTDISIKPYIHCVPFYVVIYVTGAHSVLNKVNTSFLYVTHQHNKAYQSLANYKQFKQI